MPVRQMTQTFHTLTNQQAATVNGSSFNVQGYERGEILVNLTAVTGTTPRMQVIIEGSNDNAVWYFVGQMIDEDTQGNLTELTPNADKGKITVAGQYRYLLDPNNLTSNYIRARIIVEGTYAGGEGFSGTIKGTFKG